MTLCLRALRVRLMPLATENVSWTKAEYLNPEYFVQTVGIQHRDHGVTEGVIERPIRTATRIFSVVLCLRALRVRLMPLATENVSWTKAEYLNPEYFVQTVGIQHRDHGVTETRRV